LPKTNETLSRTAPSSAGPDAPETGRIHIHPRVFPISVTLIGLAVVLTLVASTSAETFFVDLRKTLTGNAGGIFILAVNVFLVTSAFIAFGRLGDIRIGGPKARPEFSRWAWFSMLFSAGMGIGLVFYSVAEPMYHFSNPPFTSTVPESSQAASEAMIFTYFHWGLHAWGIYAMMGLALAYFAFNRGRPLALRSAFRPLLGERVEGWLGDVIDVTAVVATMFGVATSLGIGAQQVNAGLNYLLEIPIATNIQVLLIAGITLLATISVFLGLHGGIRRLSEWNMMAAGILLITVLILGPTVFLAESIMQNMGGYIEHLVQLSFWTELYQRGEDGSPTHWQQGWTIFYWAWWISWSPFVGMFIARISYGRTVREFMLSTLIVPVTMAGIWLSIFGNAALYEELFGAGGIASVVVQDGQLPVALFELLERYPGSVIASVLAMAVIVTFFVTSSDSASLVIDILTAGGHPDPPVLQRIFWAITEGVVAAALLIGGGLTALQAGAITTGLPFAILLFFLACSLVIGLRNDPLFKTHEDRNGKKEEEIT